MNSKVVALLVLLFALVIASPASADPTRPIQFDLGFGATWGSQSRTAGFDGFAGYYRSLVPLGENWAFYGAVGPNLQIGQLAIEQPDESEIVLNRFAVGPMTRLGFAYGADGDSWADFYTFVGAAPIWLTVEGADGYELGSRLSVGISFPGSWGAIYRAMEEDEDIGDGQAGSVGVFMVAMAWLLPNTIQFNAEDVGTDEARYGVSFKWTF